MPKVSVVMASYNHEKYVAETIESVLSQTYQDFEFIITDDGSPDGTVEVIKKFADSRIKLFCFSKNQGACTAMNNCIKEAKGEYIAVINSDDAWMPDKLEKQVKFLDEHPEKGAVFSYAEIIDDYGNDLGYAHPSNQIFRQPNRTRFEWLRHFFLNDNCLCHPSVLIRKACYDEMGLYDERYAQLPDFDFWIRLCMKHEIHIKPENLVKFRIHQSQASANRPENSSRHFLELIQILKSYLNPEIMDNLLNIFPVTANINEVSISTKLNKIDRDLAPFILAMVAFRVNRDAQRYFCFDVLYQMYSHKEIAQKLSDQYSFNFSNLVNLAWEQDIFGIVALKRAQSQLHQTEFVLEESQSQLHQTESVLEESQSQLHQTESVLEESQSQLHQTESVLEESQSQLHQAQQELEQSQAQLHQTEGLLEQSQAQLHQTEGLLEQSQAQLHQTEGLLEQSQAQLHQTEGLLEQSQAQLHQTEGLLEQSQAQLHQTEGLLEQSQAQLHQTEGLLEQSQAQLHQTEGLLEQSQAQLHQTEGLLEQSQAQLHQTEGLLEQSQAQLHQTECELKRWQSQFHQVLGELEDSQNQLHQTQALVEHLHSQLHQTEMALEDSQNQLHQTEMALEDSQNQLHQTEMALEDSQNQLHQTEMALEDSQNQLHQTEMALEDFQNQLHPTQALVEHLHSQLHQTEMALEDSQNQRHQTEALVEQLHSQLHQTQQELQQFQSRLHKTETQLESKESEFFETQRELEQSRSQLHQVQGELERLQFQQATARIAGEQSHTHYSQLVWDAWYAYRQNDMLGMRDCLQQSLKSTPFSRTETVINWLESFSTFSSENGCPLDTDALTNSAEWNQLMRRLTTVKALLSIDYNIS